MNLKSGLLGLALAAAIAPVKADIIWTDWTAGTVGYPGSATGTMVVDGQTINVTYTGELNYIETDNSVNWWTQTATYADGVIVPNAPDKDLIRIYQGGITNTITFSQAVDMPVMSVISVGQGGLPITFDFADPLSFNIVTQGPSYWGGGTLTNPAGTNDLVGVEGSGTIQFNGSVSSISWVNTPNEYWYGFQVGVAHLAETNPEAVPEPGTLGLGLMGLVAAVGALRLRRKA